MSSDVHCHFIPQYLLDQIAASGDEELARCVHLTRAVDDALRSARQTALPVPQADTGEAWRVHTAHNTATLPGDLVRTAGQPASGDVAVDEAATGVEATLALFKDLGRSSYDGNGATVVSTVHYEKDYDNAFWDGNQLVFGDGDGKVFERFTKPIDVLGHELAHAVTQHTANLTYQGQSGALNESMSDVFGACVKQRQLGQDAAAADWLIGEGIFLPGVNGKALRSMSEPGTAYDDPTLGKDPQVGSMADYVETTDDNGGVHLNSGIPNRAFYLAATAIGGTSWEGAGRIWYAALTSGISAETDFVGFARACVAAAGEHADVVRKAWADVGVAEGAEPTPSPDSRREAARGDPVRRVRRPRAARRHRPRRRRRAGRRGARPAGPGRPCGAALERAEARPVRLHLRLPAALRDRAGARPHPRPVPSRRDHPPRSLELLRPVIGSSSVAGSKGDHEGTHDAARRAARRGRRCPCLGAARDVSRCAAGHRSAPGRRCPVHRADGRGRPRPPLGPDCAEKMETARRAVASGSGAPQYCLVHRAGWAPGGR